MRRVFVCSLLTILLLTGCSGLPAGGHGADSHGQSPQGEQGSAQDTGSGNSEEAGTETAADAAIPGSYTVPEGWVKAEKYSTSSQVFYVQEGHENDAQPDNIAIRVGTNRYSAKDHAQFREAIVRQLLKQLEGTDAELLGDGTFTEQDYMVYIFTINEEDVVTKQYYIIDDNRYCLIHLTNFTGSEDAVQAAQDMVDSFVWDASE